MRASHLPGSTTTFWAEIAQTLLILKAIPHATHGVDPLSEGSQPLAESDDSDINRPVGYGVIWSLNAFDNLLPSESLPRVARQKMEKFEFPSRDREWLAVNKHLHCLRHNNQLANLDRVWILHDRLN